MNQHRSHVSPALEEAMHMAWDAGLDPAEDPQVQELLARDPRQLEAFAAWRARVASVRKGLCTEPTRPRPSNTHQTHTARWIAAAAAALVLGAGVWLCQDATDERNINQPTAPEPAPSTAGIPASGTSSRGRILSADLTVEHPRLQPAATTSLRQVLANRAGLQLTIHENWSVHR